MKTLLSLAAAMISGCAQAPIVAGTIPPQVLELCENIARQYGAHQRVTEKTAIGGIKGYGGAKISLAASKPFMGAVSLTNTFVAAVMIWGFLDGLMEVSDKKAAMTKQCLRDNGVIAY